MAKIVPIETRQSMFEEPSSGSKHTMYFPCELRTNHFIPGTIITTNTWKSYRFIHFIDMISTRLSGSTMMAFSSSSDTSTQEVKEDLIMLMTRSLDRTSSFFTWSPVTLVLPAMPYLQKRSRLKRLKSEIKAICSVTIQWRTIFVKPVRNVWKAHYLLDLCTGGDRAQRVKSLPLAGGLSLNCSQILMSYCA